MYDAASLPPDSERIELIDARAIEWPYHRQTTEAMTEAERIAVEKARNILADSIREHGGINHTPIEVEQHGPGRYRGKVGHNRTQAILDQAEEEGRTPWVRAIVSTQTSTPGEVALIQRMENVRRKQTTTELIVQLTTWLDEDPNRTYAQAAAKFALTREQVSLLMGIGKINGDLFDQIHLFPRKLAAKVSALSDKEAQKRYVQEYVSGNRAKRREVAKQIEADWDKEHEGKRGRKRKGGPPIPKGSTKFETEIEDHPGCFLMVTFSREYLATKKRREALKAAASVLKREETAIGMALVANGKKDSGNGE